MIEYFVGGELINLKGKFKPKNNKHKKTKVNSLKLICSNRKIVFVRVQYELQL